MKKVITCILALMMFAAGCTYHDTTREPSQSKVVTKIDVDYRFGPMTCSRSYRDNEKMREILNYIRSLKPYGIPEEPPSATWGSQFTMTLTYSDGSRKTYLQKANRYLLEEGGVWRKIDPKKAAVLGDILAQTPSDA